MKQLHAEHGWPLSVICEIAGVARSSVYARAKAEPQKRGPKTAHSDDEVVAAIKETIKASPFHGEGYCKIHARLRWIRLFVVGKNRVLRLMREHTLLAPLRHTKRSGRRKHDGKITTSTPNEMWAADATTFWTEEEGQVWLFDVVDHFNSECIGFEIKKRGDRWAAIESVRKAVRDVVGNFSKDIARGIKLRHDWGSQYTSRAFQADLRFLGIASSPAYVGEPEANGVVERFHKTIKEQCIWLHRFKNVEHARQVISAFIERYNSEWIMHRLNFRSPKHARVNYYKKALDNAA